ncbi:MAG: hypothetical protein Kow0025_26460 [Thermodesulfovibrionales bacterium]
MSNLRSFLLISLAVHLVLAALLYMAPTGAAGPHEPEAYVVRLFEPPPPPPAREAPPEKRAEAEPPKPAPARPAPPPARAVKPAPEPPRRLPEFAGKPNTLWEESGPRAGEGKPGEEKAAKEAAEAVEKKAPGDEGGAGGGTTEAPGGEAARAGEGPGTGPGEGAGAGSGQGARGKLFDKDIIAKLSRDREPPPRQDGITFDTKEFRYRSYMLRLKARIEGIWEYPPEAAARGIYGDLYIRFVIKKNGSLGKAEVIRTSGISTLDEAAVKALRDGQPYWPLPDDWEEDSLVITGHFVYSLYGMQVR